MYKTIGFVVYLYILCAIKGEKIREIAVNIGKNITIPCPLHQTRDVMWVREGREEQQHARMSILENGSLLITEVDQSDAGLYSCSRENVVNSDVKAKVKLAVRTPPPRLSNVVVRPSTILALLLWEVDGTGGYPIINFTAQYRLGYTNNSWMPISPNHIPQNSRQIEVYKLEPNTTYQFRIWATNQLGRGAITEVYGTTLCEYTELELARHFFDSADKFDTTVWAIAVGIVMGTLVLLGLGTCFLLYQECKVPGVVEEHEIIELVPNIILNPGFDPNSNADQLPDENSNSETPMLLNNNTVVHNC
ncbi:contactin-1 [Diorhabda carinulata]|uniref:contactin-1 n=1 Tax=Diorhabda sublineata TaxID=1163346 RepID=UPI0024E1461E|nr:contactin-1 [Diorhabda sublineata]XP_057661991.1 contactin-1 [Diorhabda carinulata]